MLSQQRVASACLLGCVPQRVRLGDDGCSTLCHALVDNQSVLTLDLSENSIVGTRWRRHCGPCEGGAG